MDHTSTEEADKNETCFWHFGACKTQLEAEKLLLAAVVMQSKPFTRGFAAEQPPVYPPADPTRLGTADLTDVHMPEPVDVTTERKVQVVQPGLFHDYGEASCAQPTPTICRAVQRRGRSANMS
eukprot:1160365-Pelagomonas_calceolata.AAC.13